MPVIPKYQRQIYPQYFNRQTDTRVRPVSTNTFDKDLATRIAKHNKKAERLQAVSTIVSGVLNLAQQGASIIQQAATTEFNTSLTSGKTALEQIYATQKDNPDYDSILGTFDEERNKILDTTLEGMKWEKSKKLFQAEFEKESFITRSKLETLVKDKIKARGIATMDIQYENAIQSGNPDEIVNIFKGRDVSFPMIPGGTAEGNVVHVPGAIENGFITKEEALVKIQDGLYQVNLKELDNRMHLQIEPGEAVTHTIDNALTYLTAREEDGTYKFEPWLKDEDRDKEIKSLEGERKTIIDQAQEEGSKVVAKLTSAYLKEELKYEHLEQASGAFEKKYGYKDEEYEKDLLQLKKWMEADDKAAKDAAKKSKDEYEDMMREEGYAAFEEIQAEAIEGTMSRDALQEKTTELTEIYGKYISQGTPRSVRGFIDRVEPDILPEDVTFTFKELMKSTKDVPAVIDAKQKAAFEKRVYDQRFPDGKTLNENAWTKEEIRQEAERFLKPYREEYVDMALDNWLNAKIVHEGHRNYAEDMKRVDSLEELQIILHEAVRAGDVEDIPNLENISEKLGKKLGVQFKWNPIDEMGKTSNKKAVEFYHGVPVFEADNGSKWVAYIEEGMKTEQWMPFERYKSMMEGIQGTIDNPIPYVEGMRTERGKYYIYNGELYEGE